MRRLARRRGLAWAATAAACFAGASLIVMSSFRTPTGEQSAGFDSASPELANKAWAEVRASLCSSANPAGTGLLGIYYEKSQWSGRVAHSRIDATINISSRLDWPEQSGHAIPGSVRWSGWVRAPLTGNYRFHTNNPSAVIRISNVVVADANSVSSALTPMAAGRFYPISIDWAQAGKSGLIRLEWTPPHGARYSVPQALLYPPSETTTLRQ
jgi:PA14 domain